MLLRRLFSRSRPMRHFALIDGQGICRALRQMQEQPSQAGWVEVREPNASWLGSPSAQWCTDHTGRHTRIVQSPVGGLTGGRIKVTPGRSISPHSPL